jgi:hypothetical protein
MGFFGHPAVHQLTGGKKVLDDGAKVSTIFYLWLFKSLPNH